jgi:hypothetical protein
VNPVNKKIDSSSLEISHDIYSNITASVNPLVSIFEKSGISLTQNILEQIPPYSNIIKMYGNKPTVIGLERCEEFQQQVQPPDRTLAVAGYERIILLKKKKKISNVLHLFVKILTLKFLLPLLRLLCPGCLILELTYWKGCYFITVQILSVRFQPIDKTRLVFYGKLHGVNIVPRHFDSSIKIRGAKALMKCMLCPLSLLKILILGWKASVGIPTRHSGSIQSSIVQI